MILFSLSLSLMFQRTQGLLMQIIEITQYSLALQNALTGFLEELTNREMVLEENFLRDLIESPNSHLFCAVDTDGNYVGTVTVGIYLSPTGKKAWVEDVVVSEQQRGLGIGKALTEHAITFARQQQVQSLMLTSNPTRVAANQLYRKLGFEQRTTNVYRMVLTQTMDP